MQTQTVRLDPLLYEFDLPLRAVYYPVGFPLEIATNSKEILAAAKESWGFFGKVFAYPPLELRIGVLEGGSAECPPAPVLRQQRNLRASVADTENFSISDLKRGFAFAWLTRATVENRPYLRWHFLEAISWNLLAAYLTPVHAACVRLEDRGVLLCGDSAAGKSSLAFACAKSGWSYMTDDSSSLVRDRKGPRVVGNPYQIRFRESAIELFPELKQWPLTLRATGEMSIEVRTAWMPEMRTMTECFVHYIVFLRRGHIGPPRLLRFPKQEALQWFEQVICCGEADVVEAQKASLHNLLSAEILELRYDGLAPAVSLLEAMIYRGN
ncbi:MAG TPA: hypothetical protein VEJ45_00430 [Candidatus Acidoferrales bacterium]|nr:hypothetical protein [Candidatus Acidoferrales bacterium]